MLPKVNHSQLPWFMDLCLKTKQNLLLVSEPGVGKTVSTKTYCENNGYDLIISHPAVWEPTDAKGLPAKSTQTFSAEVEEPVTSEEFDGLLDDEDTSDFNLDELFPDEQDKLIKEIKEIECATFLPFDDLLRVLTATKPTVWFLDDLGQSPGSVQAAMMQYLEGGELEGKKIPDCVHIFAATNGREHKAGVKGLLEPVKSRFPMKLHLVPDVDSFRDYMLGIGMPSEITDYMNYKPDSLMDFKPNSGMESSPCPRLWEKLGHFLNEIDRSMWNKEPVRLVCESCIGEAHGRQFHSFLSIYADLPDIGDIVDDPEGFPMDHKPDIRYALLGMLSTKGQARDAEQVFKYIRKLGKEYQLVFVRTIEAMESKLTGTKASRDWMADNSDLYLDAMRAKNGFGV